LAGIRLRCPECRAIFHVLPSENGLVETIPVVGDLATAHVLALFSTDVDATKEPLAAASNRGAESEDRLRSKTHSPARERIVLEDKPLP